MSDARLPMRPTRGFAMIMQAMNAPAYRAALGALDVAPGGGLLEIGFGSGKMLDMVARRRPDLALAGVDPTEAMVAMARRRSALRTADLKRSGAEQLPFADASFDAVLAIHCFQFWSPPEAAACEIRRVLRGRGQLLLVLRDHRLHAPNWLANPISRSSDEPGGAVRLFEGSGFGDVTLSQGPHLLLSARRD